VLRRRGGGALRWLMLMDGIGVEVSTKLGKATAGGIRFFITFALIVIVVDSGGRCAELLTDSFPSSFGDSGVSSVVSAARAVETSWVMLSGLA